MFTITLFDYYINFIEKNITLNTVELNLDASEISSKITGINHNTLLAGLCKHTGKGQFQIIFEV